MKTIILGVLCLIAVAIVLVPTVNASGFLLHVGLYDGTVNSGRVKVVVETSKDTQIKSLDVGRIVRATGDSTVDKLIFGFSDKDMPFNSAFKVCAISVSGHENCEQADRHGSVGSAAIFVQVP